MSHSAWQPKQFSRYVETIGSSSLTAVIETDAGRAFLKAINNPQGVHVLACDWIGTKLARRFGLKTFDMAILELAEDDEIPIDDKTNAAPGPAFVTRAEEGQPMGGAASFEQIENVEDIARLIVFDTWVRNCDRYGPGMGKNGEPRMKADNLFLSKPEQGERVKQVRHILGGSPIELYTRGEMDKLIKVIEEKAHL